MRWAGLGLRAWFVEANEKCANHKHLLVQGTVLEAADIASTYRVQRTVLEAADVAMNDHSFLTSTAESLPGNPQTNMNFHSFSILLLFVSLRCSPIV